MNAIQHRRLTPFLILGCTLLSALLVSVMNGWGSGISWYAPAPTVEPRFGGAALPTRQVVPLASYAEVWQRPVFRPERRPAPPVVSQDAYELDSLELTGTLMTGQLQVALLHDQNRNKDVRIRLQGDYHGWTLTALEPRRAIFSLAGRSVELTLRTHPIPAVAGQIPGNSPPSPSAIAPLQTHGVASSPAPSSGDDASARRAKLEALKAAVMKRRSRGQTKEGTD